MCRCHLGNWQGKKRTRKWQGFCRLCREELRLLKLRNLGRGAGLKHTWGERGAGSGTQRWASWCRELWGRRVWPTGCQCHQRDLRRPREQALPGCPSQQPPADRRQHGDICRTGVCPFSLLRLPVSRERPCGRRSQQVTAEVGFAERPLCVPEQSGGGWMWSWLTAAYWLPQGWADAFLLPDYELLDVAVVAYLSAVPKPPKV